jgi:hypothetical protein
MTRSGCLAGCVLVVASWAVVAAIVVFILVRVTVR